MAFAEYITLLSCFQNRLQYVSFNGFSSNLKIFIAVSLMVTILGLALFSKFINDIHFEIRYCLLHDFADAAKSFELKQFSETNE